jgi:tRNA A-37 threonylcarbamoyl transferase component Bud32/tetratricopeptide (TPR) repeat protein
MSESPSSLRELFDLLSELPVDARSAWLDRNCPDADLRRRVERLLQAQARTHDPLAVAPQERLAALASAAVATAELRQIGGFTLIRPVGQGGMATVYLAERSDFEQRVALKLLHRTILSDLDRKLFERERRVLASLEHPSIARLIDGGISEAQQPYLVMEYIEGETITDYARRHALSPAARVALLADVCDAVAIAHAQLIVHRDLKPSNVLVTADGRCKLLDFGVAKVLADEADLTGHGCAGFTPAYAAPEQRLGRNISAATDIYALGVMALELLIGGNREDLRSLPASQAAARVNDLAAEVPSTRRNLARFLRGDLDNVLRRCLDEEPQRRYQHAQALADDLRRFLAHQPVSAHPPSRWYLARKFVRRHRGGVILTALLGIATLASLALALWQGEQARTQARLAQVAAAEAQARRLQAQAALRVSEEVQEFLIGIFDAAVPTLPQASEPSVRDLVLAASERVEAELDDQPQVVLELYRRLRQIHNVIGADDEALRLSSRARAYAQAHFAPGDEPRRIAEFGDALMRLQHGEPAAFAEMEQVLTRAPAGEPSLELLAQRVQMGVMLTQRSRGEEGLALLDGTLAPLRAGCARPDSDYCELLTTALNNLGVAHFNVRNYRRARDYASEALDASRASNGEEHRETAKALGNLGMIESYLGEAEAALKHTRRAIELLLNIEGPKGAGANALRQTLAIVYAASGRPLEAVAVHEQVVASFGEQPLPGPNAGLYRLNHAKALLAVGRYDEAAAQIAIVRPAFEADPAGNQSNLPRMFEVLAVIAAERDGDAAAAAAAGERALALRHAQQPLRVQELASTLLIVQRAAAVSGSTAQTDAWLAELREVIAGISDPLPGVRRPWLLREAELALAAGDLSEAQARLEALLAEIGDATPHTWRDWASLRQIQLDRARGQPAPVAAEWLADLESRWGSEALIVREARALSPR